MKDNLYAWSVVSLILVWFYSTSLLAQETAESSTETELSSDSDPTEAENQTATGLIGQ